mmetsp:Transcript_7851/g.22323  ORF Transcript_7851/g.22323 Transcript_7851/m.22323 type:complete len:204 (+) Transcript_7851:654-1265(+)
MRLKQQSMRMPHCHWLGHSWSAEALQCPHRSHRVPSCRGRVPCFLSPGRYLRGSRHRLHRENLLGDLCCFPHYFQSDWNHLCCSLRRRQYPRHIGRDSLGWVSPHSQGTATCLECQQPHESFRVGLCPPQGLGPRLLVTQPLASRTYSTLEAAHHKSRKPQSGCSRSLRPGKRPLLRAAGQASRPAPLECPTHAPPRPASQRR